MERIYEVKESAGGSYDFLGVDRGELIRCKNCKHYDSGDMLYCNFLCMEVPNENYYCADGEKA